MIYKKNNRKSNKFKLIIAIPCSVIQVKLEDGEELNDVGDLSNDGKGVYTFKYKIIVNQKMTKRRKRSWNYNVFIYFYFILKNLFNNFMN